MKKSKVPHHYGMYCSLDIMLVVLVLMLLHVVSPAFGQQAPGLDFIVNQPDFCPGERVSVELATSPGIGEISLDLYVVIELTDGQVLFMHSNPFSPFSTEFSPFMAGIVPTLERFPLLNLNATAALAGSYIFTAAYVLATKSPDLVNIMGEIERFTLNILSEAGCAARDRRQPEQPREVARLINLTLTPLTLTLNNVGETAQLNTLAEFSDGSNRGVNDIAQWASSRPEIVFVNDLGQVAALAPGQSQVSASYSGMIVTTTVSVLEHLPLNVTGRWVRRRTSYELVANGFGEAGRQLFGTMQLSTNLEVFCDVIQTGQTVTSICHCDRELVLCQDAETIQARNPEITTATLQGNSLFTITTLPALHSAPECRDYVQLSCVAVFDPPYQMTERCRVARTVLGPDQASGLYCVDILGNFITPGSSLVVNSLSVYERTE